MGLVNSCFNGDDQAGPGDKDGSTGKSAGEKQYSWDQNRAQKDMSKYIIENVHHGEVGRMPGDVNGKGYYKPQFNLSISFWGKLSDTFSQF